MLAPQRAWSSTNRTVSGQNGRRNGANLCKRLIYKRRCQGHFSPLDWKEKVFPCFPAPVRETRRWVMPRILHGSISVASLVSSDDVDGFLELASRGGCLVGNP